MSDYGPVVSSALVANALKRLRHDSGQQQKQVADALGWPLSKLIRAESCRTRISRTDLEALLRYYGVSDQERADELMTWATEAQAAGWWQRFHIRDQAFERYVGYESGCASVRMVQGLLVPGILQTEEYARLITRTYAISEEIDSVVLLRLERQALLFARAPRQHHILDEAVLRRQVGNAMPGQLQHLVALARQTEVTIQVIPFEAGPHFGMRGPFVLLGFDAPLANMLFLESGRRSDLIVSEQEVFPGQAAPGIDDAAEEIAKYEDGFEALSQIALDRAESMSLIERIASQAR
jgi:transcriptional regulator with XRE-family HTH domain